MNIHEMLEIIDEVNEEQKQKDMDDIFFSELLQTENEIKIEDREV